MRKKTFIILLLGAAWAFLVGAAKAGEIVEGDSADAMVDQNGVNDGFYDTLYDFYVGALTGVQSGAMVEPFQLPYLAPGQTVTGATVSFYLEQLNGTPTYNLQLYGLNRVSATSSTPLEADWYTGTNDAANTLLNAKFVTPSTTVGQAITYSGGNLVTFVQNQYANAAFSGQDLSKSRFIFFRLSPDGTQGGFNNYQFGSARNPNRTYHATLALTISNGITNVAGRLQFSFNLPQASITSAGVYNTSTGALIRTLWNNVQYQSGTNDGVWDGKDDNGNVVAAGSAYQIKLIYHNVQYVWEGTIGNTSANESGRHVYRSFLTPQDMSISGGLAFYTVGYNEAQNPYHNFVIGSPQVPNEINQGFTDGNSSIQYVTSDGTRSYWAKCTGGMSASDTYIVAINTSDSSFYAFPQGTKPTGSNQCYAYTSVVDFDATANQVNAATGLAVQQNGNDLFVSHGNLNVVRVFDKVQGNLLGSFAVTNPGALHTTANGDVWVASDSATPVVQRYTFANGKATLDQTISGLVDPVGLGVSADDSLLLVADGGTSQQIKAFNNSSDAPVWTYGLAGGMAANGPNVVPNCFDFSSHSSIAFQADNTFWIRDAGNSGRFVHFSINGNTLTYIEQIAYTGASYQSTVDLTDPTRVFNLFLEYSVNYALPVGGTNGSWSLVRNWAYGLPNDTNHNYVGYGNGWTNVVTLSNGHTYGFLTNFVTGNLDLFELPASGPARPTGYSYGDNPRIYADGTLRFNINTGASLSFYSQPLSGFDSNNNPVWGSPALLASTALAATDPKTWTAYPERTETTASGMVVDYDGDQADTGYHLGGIPAGGSAWLWRSAPSTPSTYNGWFPQDGRFDIANGVNYAGNYDMAYGRNIVCGYHGELWRWGEASQWLNFLDNGLMVGRFGTYADTTVASSTTNGYAGNSFAPTLVHVPGGSTYLYANDESNHGGTIRWRIDGWDGITELDATGNIGATANLSPNTAGPTVTLTSPTPAATYVNGGNLTLSAQAASSGASVTSVQFFDGSTSLGTATTAPFTLNYSGLSVGSHVVTAKATDSNGLSATSAPVSITIGADGSSTPPPAPASLTSGAVASQSVTLNWTEPPSAATSSTIGQIISFQCDSTGDSSALTPTTVAGAPPYAAANFNLLGESSVPATVASFPNNSGAIVPNIGLGYQVAYANANGSVQSLSGAAQKLFYAESTTQYNTSTAISISNVPYATYDLVVYSLPPGIGSGPQAVTLTLSDNSHSSVVQQNFTALPTGYNVSTVAFGSNSSVTNANTIVFQGLTSPQFKLQGTSIAAFQIVERPYNQGTPTSYTIERATGTSGSFAVVGTASGTALSFTDTSSLSAGTTYQYQIQAVNSFGSSAASNTATVTTTGAASTTPPPTSTPPTTTTTTPPTSTPPTTTTTTPPTSTPPTTTTTTPPTSTPPTTTTTTPPTSTPPTTTTTTASNFSTWQSKYFTAAQLADPTISGASADPYGSGIPNLMAYALQLNPATARPTDVPSATISNGHLTLTYFVPSSITDINYIVEVSTDLATWNSGAGYTQVISSVPSSTGDTITVQDTYPPSTQKRFMHLRVTQLP
ncbi:MAG: Ig-like domain-containing protein [Methylacidiphilales bacterium]|nr:Ig-like domain-containing protein [Candidatus Methylacidiphilales bacterium]